MSFRLDMAVVASLAAASAVYAEQAYPVEIVTVKSAPATTTYRLTGAIQAVDSYNAGFRDGGRIVEVNVEVGDTVNKGDIIAKIDPTLAEANKRASQATLVAANASLVRAQQARDRAQNLLDRRSGTQADLDAAIQTFLSAQSSRDQAEANLKKAERTVEDTVLAAVRDAIVTERQAEPGQVVGEGQAVVTLANKTERQAIFYVPNAPDLDGFYGADVDLSPLNGTPVTPAKVSEISPVMSDNGSVEVKVDIDEKLAADFTIGQPVLGVTMSEHAPVISIPWTALSASDRGPAVWLVDPDKMTVQLQQITIQNYSRDTVEVASGLSEGQLVVGAGSNGLYPGRLVEANGDVQ